MDKCNWNEGQLAIGMGDNSIKLWNYSNAGSVMKKANKYHDYYDASVLWKGLQGKIEKIRCHPTREGYLAYSNEYGHVGIYDIFNLRHIPFRTYHKVQGAPSIDWGSDMCLALEDTDMKDTAISCGDDGVIHVYDINHPQAPPINLNERLKENNTSWMTSLNAKSSHRHVLKVDEKARLIAFGHTDGLVEVYRLDTLKLVFVSNCQRQVIKALDWKYFDDKTFLASGDDTGDIAIHVISTADMENTHEIPIPQPKPLHFLKGHTKSITDIKWSSHTDIARVASSSSDNFVVVWDAIKGESVSLFDRHRSRVLSLSWKVSDPDVLFSGSEDRFIYEWNHKDFSLTGSMKSRVSSVMPVSQESEKSTSRLKKDQQCMLLADKLTDGAVMKTMTEIVEKYLNDDQKLDNTLSRYIKFTKEDQPQASQHQNIHNLFFGDKEDIYHLVEIEESSYSAHNDVRNNLDIKLAMDIMQCQYKMFSKDHFDANTNSAMSDWIILALSPMVGKATWLSLMLEQAKKLESLRQFNLSAACYIACTHNYEAIEMYQKNHMFREAIALAKLRLPPNDPIINRLFGEWANELQKGDSDSLAASW
ncbi:WD40-repeat-containing domain protein [Mucor mucedo]|uniref:WD40-repeat-containing domain protein n=1 Tax=Mucor mucedo TaxID=29922 RepID=UPI00221F1A33|nr:WD40-repeat-containing domain protein [Mucor mucedo]KAI7892935.1 WD40-repeat-containing domain protein [Mucor mucedo]